jgi:hypothetical protein
MEESGAMVMAAMLSVLDMSVSRRNRIQWVMSMTVNKESWKL